MMLVVTTSSPVGPSLAADPAPMDTLVSGARTAADHQALASRYDEEAAQAKAKAAEHRQMGQTYKSYSGDKGGIGGSSMPRHCENLAKSFDGQARMYETMAATERELAKTAKQGPGLPR